MAEYCTIADVKEILASWDTLGGTGADAISDATITDAIVQGTDQTRNDLRPRYDIGIIDAFAPTYPPGVVAIAKYRAARHILDWYGQITTVQAEVIVPNFQHQLAHWLSAANSGALLDATGAAVPVSFPQTDVTNQPYATELDLLYDSGPRQRV